MGFYRKRTLVIFLKKPVHVERIVGRKLLLWKLDNYLNILDDMDIDDLLYVPEPEELE